MTSSMARVISMSRGQASVQLNTVRHRHTPLRVLRLEMLKQDAMLFPVKDSLMYIQAQPIGGRGKMFQGESFFTAENPPFGATFTYYLKEELKTKKAKRQEAERDALKKNAAISLPGQSELRAEEEEEAPAVILTITDSSGRVVRRLTGPITAGMQRVTWDLRYPASSLAPPADQNPRAFSQVETARRNTGSASAGFSPCGGTGSSTRTCHFEGIGIGASGNSGAIGRYGQPSSFVT